VCLDLEPVERTPKTPPDNYWYKFRELKKMNMKSQSINSSSNR